MKSAIVIEPTDILLIRDYRYHVRERLVVTGEGTSDFNGGHHTRVFLTGIRHSALNVTAAAFLAGLQDEEIPGEDKIAFLFPGDVGYIEKPAVLADICAITGERTIEIDVRAWFDQASDADIEALVNTGYGACEESEAVGRFFLPSNPRVRHFILSERETFAVAIQEDTANQWIAENRQELAQKLKLRGESLQACGES